MDKRKIIGVLMLALVCMLPVQVAFGAFSGAGAGTVGDPYQITTAAQLSEADDELGFYNSHFILVNDIDCSGDPAYPLWPRPNQGTRKDGIPIFGGAQGFGGTFDGQGFSILNRTNSFLNTQRPPVGGAPPIFQNIVFSNVFIRPHFLVQLEGRTAAVMPSMYSGVRRTFINIHVYGTVTNSGSYSGGLIAAGTDVTVSNCTFTGNVYGLAYVGGLVGTMNGSCTVKVSTATAEVRHAGTAGGGLIGQMSGNSLLYQCSAGGDVYKGSGEYTGGLVGLITGGGTIRECFATGDVIRAPAGTQGGGLVGGTEDNGAGDILIEDCYSTGDNATATAMGPGRNGGFVGNFGRDAGYIHLINRCYSKGDMGTTSGGGFMGRDSGAGNASRLMISNSYASGSTVANSSAGFANSSGFGVTIGNCFWTNSATSDPIATKVAGEEYFYDDSNPPFSTWDSANVWYFSGDADPVLRWATTIIVPPEGMKVLVR